ncbi:general odorant-binding protein 56a-like [Diachasmimorpha longicaudata]|uniref:general odorant-binding protein 56a-like n=1 Tax=Diachasmimorpha longicaudata TaxID=58733 RepID=UPI0030B90DE5
MNTSTVVLVFCALAVTFVSGGDMKAEMHAQVEKCIIETGVDPSVLKSLHETGGANADENVKCLGACIMKGLGVMAADGTVNLDKAKSLVPSDAPDHDALLAAVEECHAEKGANDCETAHAIGMCMHKKHVGPMD